MFYALQLLSPEALQKKDSSNTIDCRSYPTEVIELACKILESKDQDTSQLINNYLVAGYLKKLKQSILKQPTINLLQKVHNLLDILRSLKASQKCLKTTLRFCLNNEYVQKAITNKPFVYLESTEGKLLPLPFQFLPQDFIQRLWHSNLDFIDNDIIIDCSAYSLHNLELACEILVYQTSPHSLKKVEEYLKGNTIGESLQKARDLLKVIRFFGISKDTFDVLLQACAKTTNCEPNELFYSREDLYKEATEENLKSLSLSSSPQATEENSTWIRNELNTQLNLSPLARRKIAFTMALQHENQDPTTSLSYIIDQKSWQDLELLCGPKSNPHFCFASAVDRTSTEIGKALLYTRLLQPLTTIQELKKRQSIVQELLKPSIFQELDALFAQFFKEPKHENNVLSFLNGADFFKNELSYNEIQIPFFAKFSQWFNTNEITGFWSASDKLIYKISNTLLQGKTKTYEFCLNGLEYFSIIKNNRPRIDETIEFIKCCFKFFIPKLVNATSEKSSKQASDMVSKYIVNEKISLGIPFTKYKLPQEPSFTSPIFGATLGWAYSSFLGAPHMLTESIITTSVMHVVTHLLYSAMSDNNYSRAIQGLAEASICLQEKLILLSKYVKFIKELHTFLKNKSPKLLELIPSLQALDLGQETPRQNVFSYFWHFPTDITKQYIFTDATSFEQFISKLCSATFDEQGNIFSRYHIGRVIAIYRLVDLHKERLSATATALAELDAYLSVARLYNESQDKPNKYSFVNYDTSETPVIDLKNFWNPCVGYDAVANTLTMGIDNHPKDLIITGPNTGGKSTLMRALVSAILMGQSLGIVPAQEGSHITLFSNIRAYLNITDDSSLGLSLFWASARRAKELLEAAQRPTGHSLTLFDEIYNGTAPKIGESLAYGTLLFMTDSNHCPRNICITTTHYPFVQQLREEIDTKCAYYRISDKEDSENRYKLLPGIYTESNGLTIAQEVGLNDEISRNSKHYCEQKYKNSNLNCLFKPEALLNTCKEEGFIFLMKLIKQSEMRAWLHELLLTAPYGYHLVELAIKHAVNLKSFLNLTDDKGRTVLHRAAIRDAKNGALISFLIKQGASLWMYDAKGKRPRDYALPDTVVWKILVDAENTQGTYFEQLPQALRDRLQNYITYNKRADAL